MCRWDPSQEFGRCLCQGNSQKCVSGFPGTLLLQTIEFQSWGWLHLPMDKDTHMGYSTGNNHSILQQRTQARTDEAGTRDLELYLFGLLLPGCFENSTWKYNLGTHCIRAVPWPTSCRPVLFNIVEAWSISMVALKPLAFVISSVLSVDGLVQTLGDEILDDIITPGSWCFWELPFTHSVGNLSSS